ncbi:hypothetical protein GCM10027514_31420 [Azotobacter armeniacus]
MIEDFQGLPAFQKAQVRVGMPEREYRKQISLEEGVRSLLGVIMATSACPRLARLRPMEQQHPPFASQQEFALRAVSLYLAWQYFNFRERRHADWELKGACSSSCGWSTRPSGSAAMAPVVATRISRPS